MRALEFCQPVVDSHPRCGSNRLITYCCPSVVPLPTRRVTCELRGASVLRCDAMFEGDRLLSRAYRVNPLSVALGPYYGTAAHNVCFAWRTRRSLQATWGPATTPFPHPVTLPEVCLI